MPSPLPHHGRSLTVQVKSPPRLQGLRRFAVVAQRQSPAASPIPHPVGLDSIARLPALQRARALSSPTDIIAYQKRLQATAAGEPVPCEAEEPLEEPAIPSWLCSPVF
jgi:hypothetical protein